MIDSHEIFPSSHNIFRKDKNRHDIKINSSNVKLEKKTVYNFNNENINELREAIRISNLTELVENGTNINEAWEK